MSADQGVHCEHCGTYIALLDSGVVHVCPMCRVINCEQCWVPVLHRCSACAATLTAAGTNIRQLRGLAAARNVLGQLTELQADLDALVVGNADGDASTESDADLDRRLLGAWARTLLTEGRAALAATAPQSASKVAALERQFDSATDAIDRRLAEIRIQRLRRDAHRAAVEIRRLRMEERARRRRTIAQRVAPYREQLARIAAAVIRAMRSVAHVGGPKDASPAAARSSRPHGWLRGNNPIRLGVAVAGTMIVLAIILAGPRWLDQWFHASVGEGVLGGTPGADHRASGSPLLAASAPTLDSSTASVGPAASPMAVGVNFDGVRMGEGIGKGWVQTSGEAGSVAVAALPTAVDRSARFVVVAGVKPGACRDIQPPLPDLTRMSVDLVLDSEVPATAVVELRDTEGNPIVSMTFGESRAVVLKGTSDVLVESDGLRPGSWYRVELVTGRAGAWRIIPVESGLHAMEGTVALSGLSAVGSMCLAADGRAQAAVNFDNIDITTR
jgi:hypothetical protein